MALNFASKTGHELVQIHEMLVTQDPEEFGICRSTIAKVSQAFAIKLRQVTRNSMLAPCPATMSREGRIVAVRPTSALESNSNGRAD